MSGNRPPVMASNTELLGTLHRMEQSLDGIGQDIDDVCRRLNTVESHMEERERSRSRDDRPYHNRGRGRNSRFRDITPRRLDYGDRSPIVEIPEDHTLVRAEGSSQRRSANEGNTRGQPLAEALGIAQENLAMIVRLASREAGGSGDRQDERAPSPRRNPGGNRYRNYRGVKGRARNYSHSPAPRQRQEVEVEILSPVRDPADRDHYPDHMLATMSTSLPIMIAPGSITSIRLRSWLPPESNS